MQRVKTDFGADDPVRACHRYIAHRSDCLDYQGALAQDLPIGSGEIEGEHRYVFQDIQDRPKIVCAWWKLQNLAKIAALRLLRANRGWQDYWSEIGQTAA